MILPEKDEAHTSIDGFCILTLVGPRSVLLSAAQALDLVFSLSHSSTGARVHICAVTVFKFFDKNLLARINATVLKQIF